MFLSPLPVVLEWHCVMCGRHFPGKSSVKPVVRGIYSERCTSQYVYSYQPDLFGTVEVRALNPKFGLRRATIQLDEHLPVLN